MSHLGQSIWIFWLFLFAVTLNYFFALRELRLACVWFDKSRQCVVQVQSISLPLLLDACARKQCHVCVPVLNTGTQTNCSLKGGFVLLVANKTNHESCFGSWMRVLNRPSWLGADSKRSVAGVQAFKLH